MIDDILAKHNAVYVSDPDRANVYLHGLKTLTEQGLRDVLFLAKLVVLYGSKAEFVSEISSRNMSTPRIVYNNNTPTTYVFVFGKYPYSYHFTIDSIIKIAGQAMNDTHCDALGVPKGSIYPAVDAINAVALRIRNTHVLSTTGPANVLASFAKKMARSKDKASEAMSYLANGRANNQAQKTRAVIDSIKNDIKTLGLSIKKNADHILSLKNDLKAVDIIRVLASKAGEKIPRIIDEACEGARYGIDTYGHEVRKLSAESRSRTNDYKLNMAVLNKALKSIKSLNQSHIASQLDLFALAKKKGRVLFFGADKKGKRFYVGIPGVVGTSKICGDDCVGQCCTRPTRINTGRLVLDYHSPADCSNSCMGIGFEPIDIQRNLWGHTHTAVGCGRQCFNNYANDINTYMESGKFYEATVAIQHFLSSLNLGSPLLNRVGISNTSYEGIVTNVDGKYRNLETLELLSYRYEVKENTANGNRKQPALA